MKKTARLLAVLAATFLVFPFLLSAQENRGYFYDSISQKFTVNTDTTVDVEETDTYHFNGEYHKGWRSILLNKVSNISDVAVFDGATGAPLQYISRPQDKTNPENWGKYTYSRRNGNLEIEWYFNAADESRAWILKYKLVGAVSFLKEKDELYWNLFTDFDVPVGKAEATVIIPGNTYSPGDLQARIYVTGAENPKFEIVNNKTFYFSAENIQPKGVVTVAAGWPKNLINRAAFWRQFLWANLPWMLSVLIFLGTLIGLVFYWYITEKLGKGRGTIVAEYDPPRKLHPAMAEVIVRERVTSKGWAATVVDLAVRGYVKITEEPAGWLGRWGNKDYVIDPLKTFENSELGRYEQKFLAAIFGTSGAFSTKAMRRDRSGGMKLYREMKEVEKTLFEETDRDTGAYEKPVSKDKFSLIGIFLLIFGGVLLIPAGVALSETGNGFWVLPIAVVLCALAVGFFVKFEARLSAEGAIFREEWLGFKLYLQTAEKYRLQNLTPETFEKYLPYAIIFGVEKEWGKAFDGISMPPPNWYHGVAVANFSSGTSGGFSASAFSASFSSSFTSAFSSSGGAGASGGGGGAGGGGGGGGGGAS